jgi:hypothetical protein
MVEFYRIFNISSLFHLFFRFTFMYVFHKDGWVGEES